MTYASLRSNYRLSEAIQSLVADSRSVDVRIRCKDHNPSDGLGAHKLMLAAASPNLLKMVMLEDQDNSENLLCLHFPDYTSTEVGLIISLLYYGEVWISPERLPICQEILDDLRIEVKLSFNPEAGAFQLTPKQDVKVEAATDPLAEDDVKWEVQRGMKSPEIPAESSVLSEGDDLSGNGDEKLFCTFSKTCHFSTSSLSRFQCHRLVHLRKVLKCSRCLVDFEEKASYEDHLTQHFEEGKMCEMAEDCDFVIGPRIDDFFKHVRLEHEGFLNCDFPSCHFSTKDSSNMTQHLRIHNDERNFECTVCQQKFISSSNLKVHTRSVHTKEKMFYCDYCEKGFATKWQMKSHVKTNHLKEKVMFDCQKCERSFYKSQSLAAHLKHCSTSRQKFKRFQVCETCGVKLKGGITSLRRHQCVCRTGDVDLKCPICSKTVSSRSLKSHMQYHKSQTDNKTLLTCFICNKTLTSSTSLKRHLLIHENFKPFECDVCGKEFRQKSTLETHSRVHTGFRFSCPAGCGNFFITKSLLKIHLKSSISCRM